MAAFQSPKLNEPEMPNDNGARALCIVVGLMLLCTHLVITLSGNSQSEIRASLHELRTAN
jgi:hypothetical protein